MPETDLGARIIALTDTLYRVAYGLLPSPADREDAVQSAIEKAWRKAERLRDPDKLRPWLIRILVNECHNIGRGYVREVPSDALPDIAGPDTSDQSALREAILTLPELQRVPIVLHYMEGFSIQEIAAALRCPRGTVLSRMDRARKRLKTLLSEEESYAY